MSLDDIIRTEGWVLRRETQNRDGVIAAREVWRETSPGSITVPDEGTPLLEVALVGHFRRLR